MHTHTHTHTLTHTHIYTHIPREREREGGRDNFPFFIALTHSNNSAIALKWVEGQRAEVKNEVTCLSGGVLKVGESGMR